MKLRRYAAGFLAAVLFVLFSVFPAFAEPHTFGELDAYLVETASDAVLLDSASIMPYSSIGTVTNTVDLSKVRVVVYYIQPGFDDVYYQRITPTVLSSNQGASFSYTVPSGYIVIRWSIELGSSSAAIPPAGSYLFSMDFQSDISMDYSRFYIWTNKNTSNASIVSNSMHVPFSQSSGDVYVSHYAITLTNVSAFNPTLSVDTTQNIRTVGGSFRINFTPTSDTSGPSTVGTDTSQQDWENSISSGLGDISSSLDSVDESLQYISNSQNLIIQGIDNVILHISDQLYAFWDQLYNLIHVPTYSMLQQILQAIHDLDINVDVNLDDLTDTLEENHAEQIANDNQIADDIQNGYDSSGLASSDQKLDAALEDQAEKEDQVMEQISESLESFTFTNPISQYLDTFLVLGDFLQDLYTASGALKDVINLSFLMGIALMVVGLSRFKGGN